MNAGSGDRAAHKAADGVFGYVPDPARPNDPLALLAKEQRATLYATSRHSVPCVLLYLDALEVSVEDHVALREALKA